MQTEQLARLLREEGVVVELVQTNAPYRPDWVGRIKGLRALFRLFPYLLQIWRLAGSVHVIHVMANSGWSWTLFSAPVLWIGHFRKTPVIVNYRGGKAREYLQKSINTVRPSLSKASDLVVPSPFLREVFGSYGIDSLVISNIIDLETFRPRGDSGPREGFSLVITRNLEPIYGIDVAIRALAKAKTRVPQLRLEIAGSGPMKAELEQLACSLGVAESVTFLGRLSRSEIVALYQSADAMLNPVRVDNMPNSILEAMASGLPVISTNVGGIPFIVSHEHSAMLTPVDDAESMSETIVSLVTDREMREKLVRNGLKEVAKYGWPEVKPKWLALYKQRAAA